MTYFSLAGVVIILIFTVFVWSKTPKGTVDFLLIAFNILLGSFIGLNALNMGTLTEFSLIAQNTLPFFIFPLFALMVLHSVNLSETVSKRWWLLFLPGILFLVIAFVRHATNSFSQADLLEEYNFPPLIYHVLFKGFQLTVMVVLYFLLKKLKTHQKKIENRFSYIEPIEISWLYNFGVIYFAMTALTMLVFLVSNLKLLPINIDLAFGIINGLLVLAVFYMNFQGIKHYTITQYQNTLSKQVNVVSNQKVHQTEEEKPTKETSIKSEEIFKHAQNAIESQQLFLEPTLRLKDVASAIEQNPHALSEAINNVGQKTFYAFVNDYRVSFLKNLLQDPSKTQLTILGLGLESGFNSKASMNRIFKQSTGMTPLEYQKSGVSLN